MVVGGQTIKQPTVEAIDQAEVASQVQLTNNGSKGFSTTSDGELDPVQDVTEDDLESKVDTSPAAEATNEKWEQHYKICVPALVGQEDPGMDTGSPAAQPGILKPLAQEVEFHEPLEQEVDVDKPLKLEVVLPDDRQMQVCDVLHGDQRPAQQVGLPNHNAAIMITAQTPREEEKTSNEEDNEGDSMELLADLAAVSPTDLGYQQMDGVLLHNTVIEK